MNYVERRSIDELAALYELEPTIRDIFVEGTDDVSLITWYVRSFNQVCSVTAIDAIDVPSDLLEGQNTLNGNRGRVIALAHHLNKVLDGTSRNCVTLIIDTDYDRINGASWNIDFLLATDYTCLEAYLFETTIFNKLLSVVLGGASVSAEIGLKTLADVLKRLWLCKAVNQLLGLSMSWISFTKNCKISGNRIMFEEEEFINRYLTANGRNSHKNDFLRKRDELAGLLPGDPRHAMDGHHFMELSRWYLRIFVKDRRPLTDQRTFERAYFGCIELSLLDEHELFKKIALRINEPSIGHPSCD